MAWPTLTLPRTFGPLAGPVPLSYLDENFSALKSPLATLYAERMNVKDPQFAGGAKGDGSSDDTAAFQACLSLGGGIIAPGGRYRITSPLLVTKAVELIGSGATPGSQLNDFVSCIDHDFTGDLFYVTGVAGSPTQSCGIGLRNLLLRQVAGTGTGVKGNAIHFYATSDSHYPSWMRIENCNIEEVSGRDAWTYCLYADGLGSSVGARDIWISKSRFQSGPLATGCVKILRGANVFLTDTLLNTEKGNLEITGEAAKLSSAIYVLGGGGAALTVDYGQNVRLMGGGWADVTLTSNSLANQIFPNFITNAPSLAGLYNTVVAFVSATGKYSIYSTETITLQNAGGLVTTSGALLAGLGIGVGNSADGDVTGTAKTKKIPIFDTAGNLLCYLQGYAGP